MHKTWYNFNHWTAYLNGARSIKLGMLISGMSFIGTVLWVWWVWVFITDKRPVQLEGIYGQEYITIIILKISVFQPV